VEEILHPQIIAGRQARLRANFPRKGGFAVNASLSTASRQSLCPPRQLDGRTARKAGIHRCHGKHGNHSQRLLADVEELETLAAGASGEPRGELRINAPITQGKRVVLPVLSGLLPKYLGMTADGRLSDQICDVVA
jgi:hypothetical protein